MVVIEPHAAAVGVRALGGTGWVQVGELGVALVLSAAIGMEREIRQKSAGLRTHTLVRGLTTAAAIWVTAAIGAAAGAGLPILAALATIIYFLVAVAFPVATRWFPASATAISAVRVRYPDGRGVLRDVLREATARGFAIDDVATKALGYRESEAGQNGEEPAWPTVQVVMHVHGKKSVNELAAALSEIEGVDAVLASDISAIDE